MAITTPASDIEADETMRLAVERFRTKMESSNRQFLQDRTDEIEAMGLSTEEEKLQGMRAYWPGLGRKGEVQFNDGAPPGHVRQTLEERNVTRLADVKTVYHQYMDGTTPPFLRTDEWRQMCLETIQSACNETAFRGEGDEDLEIPPCHDLVLLLKYVDSVEDPDFRHSGIAPFEPPILGGIRDDAFKDSPAVIDQPEPDISESREILMEHLRQFLCEENFVEAFVDDDLEVKVGFRTGTGCQRGYDMWHSAYLYCRRFVDDGDPSYKDWAWRVVFFRAEIDNPTMLYGRNPRFDSIPEFLDWYSGWLEYLDLDQMRKDVSESDSDEEL